MRTLALVTLGALCAWPALDAGGPWLGRRFNDYNGDGITELAVYDRLDGEWFIRPLGSLQMLTSPTPSPWFGPP